MIEDLYKQVGDTFAPPPEKGEVRLPNGCTLFWVTTEQGRLYISDEVGGGVEVWHTALVEPSTLMAAMVQESAFQKLEQVIDERARTKKFNETMEEVIQELANINERNS
jgi:hypothetical protein